MVSKGGELFTLSAGHTVVRWFLSWFNLVMKQVVQLVVSCLSLGKESHVSGNRTTPLPPDPLWVLSSHQEYGSKSPKIFIPDNLLLYCWLWDCDKNKSENIFQTEKWICIIRLLEIGSLSWTCVSDGKVPAFRENEAMKSKWMNIMKCLKIEQK